MKKAKGDDASWGDVFKHTHLEKSAKVRLASGELIGSQPEHWINKKSWTVFDKYEKAMSEKYGRDPTQHPLGDAEIWQHCSCRIKKGRVYGVGSVDPTYVVSGTTYECGSSSRITRYLKRR